MEKIFSKRIRESMKENDFIWWRSPRASIALLPLSSDNSSNVVIMAVMVDFTDLMEECLHDHLVSLNLTSSISFNFNSFCFLRRTPCGTEDDI